MVLTRWDPRYELRRMQSNMDRVWRGFPFTVNASASREWAIPLDVIGEEDTIKVKAALPGFTAEDIEVSLEDRVLTIKAEAKAEGEGEQGEYLVRERRSGSFHRSLRLPDTVDADKVEPHYENGVLTITLPKVEAKKAKQLKISTGTAPEGGEK